MILQLFSLYREADFSIYGVAPDFPLGRTLRHPSGGREVWRISFEAVFAKQARVFTQQDNFSSFGEEPLGTGGMSVSQPPSKEVRKSQAHISIKLQPPGQELEALLSLHLSAQHSAVLAEPCSHPQSPKFRGTPSPLSGTSVSSLFLAPASLPLNPARTKELLK